MQYLSTRGGDRPQQFTEILLGGLAADGGLMIAEQYPRVSAQDLAQWRTLSYPDLAFQILRRFATDIPEADLKQLIDKTYTAEVFGSADITPLATLEADLHILGLSNGPTLAFKDVAMQLIGNLFEYTLAKQGKQLNILGATSGDTGSAAEYAMRGKQGIRVFMLSPNGRMSPFQTAQMYSLPDQNIYNIAIEGVFDDAQDIVKAVSQDLAFKAQYNIGTVNSINWARVMAQVVYYFKGYFAATQQDNQEVSFAVPSGNFGNVYAGHIAHMMGLPIRKLIVATNENDVLDEFFRTGAYRVRPQTELTSSPSMDISKASNFERFIYDLVGRDPAIVRDLWQQVDQAGGFDLSTSEHWAKMSQYGFSSGRSTHADRIANIQEVYQKYGVIIDTHTADGYKAAVNQREAGVPMIILETALAAKFEDTIREALGRDPERPAVYQNIEALPQHFTVMPVSTEQVKDFIRTHVPLASV